jgi:hypothetical protein
MLCCSAVHVLTRATLPLAKVFSLQSCKVLLPHKNCTAPGPARPLGPGAAPCCVSAVTRLGGSGSGRRAWSAGMRGARRRRNARLWPGHGGCSAVQWTALHRWATAGGAPRPPARPESEVRSGWGAGPAVQCSAVQCSAGPGRVLQRARKVVCGQRRARGTSVRRAIS